MRFDLLYLGQVIIPSSSSSLEPTASVEESARDDKSQESMQEIEAPVIISPHRWIDMQPISTAGFGVPMKLSSLIIIHIITYFQPGYIAKSLSALLN